MNSNVHELGQQFFWLSSKCVIATISNIMFVTKYFHMFSTKNANEKYQQQKTRCFSAENLFDYFVNSFDSW